MLRLTARTSGRTVTLRDRGFKDSSWDHDRLGLLLADLVEAICVPRRGHAAAAMVAYLFPDDGPDDGPDGPPPDGSFAGIERAERAMARAARRVVDAWEAFDEALDADDEGE